MTPTQTASWLEGLAADLARIVSDAPHDSQRRRKVLDVVGKLRRGAQYVRGEGAPAVPVKPNGEPNKSSPLAELLNVVRVGVAMRKAQRAYFEKKTAAELSAARDAERRFDAAAKDALAREQLKLPGMDGEGGEP